MTIYAAGARNAPGIVARSFGREVPFRPFLLVDHFDMDRDVFPPHPHAGVCVLTYLLPESGTSLRNRDDLENDLLIEPGALHWTTAGAGIIHHEAPVTPDARAVGLQIFVDLPPDDRRCAPGILDLAAADVPVEERDGARIRCVLGRFGRLRSPLRPPVAVGIADVELAAGAEIEAVIPGAATAFAFVERGEASVAGSFVRADHMIRVPLEGPPPRIAAGDRGARIFLFSTPNDRA